MKRYDTRINDGTLYIEDDEDDLEIGTMDDICEILGGESYTIEYNEEAQAAGWLQTDEDGTITFDIPETIDELDYDKTFVQKMVAQPIDQMTPEGYPLRTVEFADLMAEIWDSKGNIELE